MDSGSARDERLRLQRLLLPAALPDIGCTEAAAAYRPHNHELNLGGDWFDLIDRPESQSVVAIVGDVVGHGVEQISVMGQLRAASNALAHSIEEPDAILAGLDRFAASIPAARFATLAVVVIDGSETGRICCAGHPPPIRIDAEGGVHIIEGGRRPPLTFAGGAAAEFAIALGDLLVIYTDGVVERPGTLIDDRIAALGRFVNERFDRSCHEIVTDIVDVFGVDAQDDQAVLVLRPIHNRGPDYDLAKATQSSVSWTANNS